MKSLWEKPFYYASTSTIGFYEEHWLNFYPSLEKPGRFWLDLARFFGDHNCLLSRHGDWKAPWDYKVVPGFEMPTYQPQFAKSFDQITNERAIDMRNLIRQTDKDIALFYSGGIDSTICLASLIQNLDPEELKKIHVCMSVESIEENPHFYQKFIHKKMNIIDSSVNRYSDILAKGFFAITADQGDCLFGTEAAIQLYRIQNKLLHRLSSSSRSRLQNLLSQKTASELPYTEFADLIPLYFHLEHNPEFGSKFYELLLQNIQSGKVPIYSLHDFFWWIIFNLKYMHCAMRCVIAYSGQQDQKFALQEGIINWFNHPDYQHWSLANNNNGEKIRGTSPTAYKWAGREYIFKMDKNEWYRHHKMKLASLGAIIMRSSSKLDRISVFGMSTDYEIIRLNDPGVLQKVEASLREFQF